MPAGEDDFENAAAARSVCDIDAALEQVDKCADDVQAEASTCASALQFVISAHEHLEDAPPILRGNSCAIILNANGNSAESEGCGRDDDAGGLATIFDGVIDEISEDHFEEHAAGGESERRGLELEDFGDFEFMLEAGSVGAITEELFEGDGFGFGLLTEGIEAGDFEELVNEPIESCEFGIHGFIEVSAVCGVGFTEEQCVEIESERGDGRFEFVSDAVDEVGLSSIELNFLDGEEGVEGDTEEADGKSGGAEDEAAPGTLAGELDDEDSHERDIDGHQQHAAPNGQSEVSFRAAEVGHIRRSP
ncbi:MAG: hypothetical protein RL215_701 [Planctomycetota bacterium]